MYLVCCLDFRLSVVDGLTYFSWLLITVCVAMFSLILVWTDVLFVI